MPEYLVMVEMQDSMGRKTRKQFKSDPAVADFAAALTIANNLVVDLAALSEARVLAYTVAQRVIFVDGEDIGANKDEGLTLVVEKTDNYRATLKVPAPIQSVRNNDGTADVASTEIANYIANFADGAIRFTVSDGEFITGVVNGRIDT